MSKKVVITEHQMDFIMAHMLSESLGEKKYPIEPEKVLVVKKFLDDHCKRGQMDIFGEDGLPQKLNVIALVNSNGDVMKNMYKDDALELLIDKFKNMFLDKDYRKKFMTKVLDD